MLREKIIQKQNILLLPNKFHIPPRITQEYLGSYGQIKRGDLEALAMSLIATVSDKK